MLGGTHAKGSGPLCCFLWSLSCGKSANLGPQKDYKRNETGIDFVFWDSQGRMWGLGLNLLHLAWFESAPSRVAQLIIPNLREAHSVGPKVPAEAPLHVVLAAPGRNDAWTTPCHLSGASPQTLISKVSPVSERICFSETSCGQSKLFATIGRTRAR